LAPCINRKRFLHINLCFSPAPIQNGQAFKLPTRQVSADARIWLLPKSRRAIIGMASKGPSYAQATRARGLGKPTAQEKSIFSPLGFYLFDQQVVCTLGA
jgi:hypothetical protein